MNRLRLLAGMALGMSLLAACGNGTSPPRELPPGWSSVTVGLFHTCGIYLGEAYCFGDDRTGQLGAQLAGDSVCRANGFSNPCRPRPARVSGPKFTLIHSGRMTTCGVAADGTWCWGNSTPSGGVAAVPAKVTSTRFVALATKVFDMCGLTAAGEVYCWSLVGTTQPPPLTLVSGNIPFASLSGSYNHLCGLSSSGDAYCWGENTRGELAVGDTLPRDTPTRVASTLRFVRISAGNSRTCAIATDHHTYCSGATFWTASRQPDDSLHSIRFVAVPGGDDFVTVTVGGGVACGVTANLDARCWGSNGNALLGIGAASGSIATPARISGGHLFTEIVAGTYHACGVTVDSELYCWGFDHAGQLGSVGFPVTCTLSDEFYACTGTPVLVPKP